MSKAVIKNGRYTIEPLYQWDLNQVLQIYGLSLSRVPEVHFSNVALESALVRQCTMDGTGVITVDIPNSLLQRPYPIKAHVCIYEGKTFESLYTIDIPVKPRKMPADYSLENDRELFSFKEMNNRLAQVENELSLDEAESFYKYEYKNSNLAESNVTTTRRLYIPFISSSLKAIKSFVDKIATTLTGLVTAVETALSIAKGRNQARVFNTTDDMREWLSNAENANKCSVGDNLYIVDTEVPDWWISEVLNTVDIETGYYYKIAQLETQKVEFKPDILWTNPDASKNMALSTIECDLSEFKSFKVIFAVTKNLEEYAERTISLKNKPYYLRPLVYGPNTSIQFYRTITISNTSINIDNCYINSTMENSYLIPVQILGYKY